MTVYLVKRPTGYRGHPAGTRFEAVLEPGAERRALARGDVVIIHRRPPGLPAGYRLPDGWTTEKEAPDG